MSDNEITYKSAGVDYDSLDKFKREAQRMAEKTEIKPKRGYRVVEWSRGESVFLMEGRDNFIAHVEEGLGTKNLIADAMITFYQRYFYKHIAHDTVAMIINDMITLGAMPLSVAMHLAVGSSDWFGDKFRYKDLISGWKLSCKIAGCAWGGGETPTLKGIIYLGGSVIAGSAVGIINPKTRLIDPANIENGDVIILVRSSGIHANGLTLSREIAENSTISKSLAQGLNEKLDDGRTFGESLLDATIIYAPLVDDCLDKGIKIHYAVNITGHGWRKLMRANSGFNYVIDKVFEPQPVFRFIQERGPVNIKEMYSNFNMGAGFALYVRPDDADLVIETADLLGMEAIKAGYIEKTKKEKRVIIRPNNLIFNGSSLQVR